MQDDRNSFIFRNVVLSCSCWNKQQCDVSQRVIHESAPCISSSNVNHHLCLCLCLVFFNITKSKEPPNQHDSSLHIVCQGGKELGFFFFQGSTRANHFHGRKNTRNTFYMSCPYRGAYFRHSANSVARSVCGLPTQVHNH
jgi:hypothetical protein